MPPAMPYVVTFSNNTVKSKHFKKIFDCITKQMEATVGISNMNNLLTQKYILYI